MLNITLRSASWMLAVFILAASGLVAADIGPRNSPARTSDVVTGSTNPPLPNRMIRPDRV